jgi:hypothetical protein
MKVQHKNSLEVFELTEPIYTKYYLYGYLVGMCGKIFFITSVEDNLDCIDITDDFIIL